jgi:hypothetical protein
MHGQPNIKKTRFMVYMYLAFERNTHGNTIHHPSTGDEKIYYGNTVRYWNEMHIP